MLTFGSLFSGIGGFDLGMERAGLQAIWQCEIDKDCQRVLKRHWPNTRLYQNVKEINQSNTATPDVIVGGFPCQDLSIAGKRKGLAGERSGLWFEFHRIIKELKPGWVVIENVPGLLSSNSGRDFAIILSGLAECGYYAAWRVLDAQYFGVAQRRRRVFIVASLDGSCAQVLFESESGAWDSPPSREAGERVAGTTQEGIGIAGSELGYTLRSNPSHSGDKGDGGVNTNLVVAYGGNNTGGPIEVATAVNAGHGSRRYDFESETFVTAYTINFADSKGSRPDRPNGGLYVREVDQSDAITGNGSITHIVSSEDNNCLTPWDAESKRIHSADGIAPTLAGSDGKGGQRLPYVCNTFNGYTGGADDNDAQGNHLVVGFDSSRSQFTGDIATPLRVNGAVSPGVNDGKPDNMCVSGGFGVRRLTPVECERLQGFPDGWTEWGSTALANALGITEPVKQSDSARYRQLGNAVAVPCAEWIGRRIAQIKLL